MSRPILRAWCAVSARNRAVSCPKSIWESKLASTAASISVFAALAFVGVAAPTACGQTVPYQPSAANIQSMVDRTTDFGSTQASSAVYSNIPGGKQLNITWSTGAPSINETFTRVVPSQLFPENTGDGDGGDLQAFDGVSWRVLSDTAVTIKPFSQSWDNFNFVEGSQPSTGCGVGSFCIPANVPTTVSINWNQVAGSFPASDRTNVFQVGFQVFGPSLAQNGTTSQSTIAITSTLDAPHLIAGSKSETLVESRSGGQNFSWYAEDSGGSPNLWQNSTAKSTVAGVTPGIGSRFNSSTSIGGDITWFEVSPTLPSAGGIYEIYATTTTASGAIAATSNITATGGHGLPDSTNAFSTTVSGNRWALVGTIALDPGETTPTIRFHETFHTNRFYADAILFAEVPTDTPPTAAYWTNAAGGSFTNAANWNTGIPANMRYVPRFNLPASYTVSFDTASNISMEVLGGDVTFNIANTYTLLSRSVANQVAGRVGGGGTLKITNGTFQSNTFHVGAEGIAGPGTLIVDGPNSRFESPLWIGALPNTTGHMEITGGAQVSAWGPFPDAPENPFQGAVNVGAIWNNSNGTLLVSGKDVGTSQPSTLTAQVISVAVGGLATTGSGMLTIENGAQVVTSILNVGHPSSQITGTLVVEGADTLVELDAAFIHDTITVANGATINSTAGLESFDGSQLTVTNAEVTSAGSFQFNGTVQFQNGATVSSASGQFASDVGSQGTGTISGPSTSWTLSQDLVLGGANSAPGGAGILTVTDHAQVDVGQDASVSPISTLNVRNGASITVGGTLHVRGAMRGDGTIVGSVLVDGRVRPGNSPGFIDIDGDYMQTASGVLEIEVGGLIPGTLHDQVRVTGMATLAGRLEVPLVEVPGFPTYAPQIDDEIVFLTADGGVDGEFDSVFLPTLPANVAHEIDYNENDVVLKFVAPEPILFVSTDSVAVWANNTTWEVDGMAAVPESKNVISVQNLAGVPQTVDVVTSNESAHQLVVGDTDTEIAIRLDGVSLSVAAGTVIEDNGAIEIDNDGTLVSQTVDIETGGVLSGEGTIKTNTLMVSGGTLEPGVLVGHLEVEGNYIQGQNGRLEIDVEGNDANEFDTLQVIDNAQLSGTVVVDASALTGMAPGETVTFLTAGKLEGEFDEMLTVGRKDVYFVPVYSEGGGGSAGAMLCNKGNMNCDPGDVMDSADIAAFALALRNPLLYRQTYGVSGATAGSLDGYATGNFAPDNDLDFDDINDFAALMASSGGGSMAGVIERLQWYLSVPEPSSCILLLSGIAAWMSPRRHRPVSV